MAAGAALLLALPASVGGCGSIRPAQISRSAVFITPFLDFEPRSAVAAPSQQGGDLRNLHLPRIELFQLTVEMPPVHGPLTARELRAVVDYLQAIERRSSRS